MNHLIHDKYMKRPRINSMLMKGIKYPLTTLIAGPGYGKTTAVYNFIKQHDYPCIWLNLSVFDNDITSFWAKVEQAAWDTLPPAGEIFSQLSFPATAQEFIIFKNKINTLPQKTGKIIVAIDNYELITNEAILQFLHRCIYLNYDSSFLWHYIIISNKRLIQNHNLLHETFQNIGEYNQITAGELSFNLEELNQLCVHFNVHRTADELEQLLADTDGWPIYNIMLFTENDCNSALLKAYDLFENQYYIGYPPEFRILLVKLSLLSSFSLDLIKAFYNDHYLNAMEEISQNIYVEYDFSNHVFHFQAIYKKFLQGKLAIISDQEKHNVLNTAGDYFFSLGMYSMARDLFIDSGNYEALIKCLSAMITEYNTVDYISTVQQILNGIPAAYADQNPWLTFHLAYTYLNGGQVEKARLIFTDLLNALESNPEVTDPELLVETCCMLTDISLLQNNTDGLTYIAKGISYLPRQDSVFAKKAHLIAAHPIFFMPSETDQTVTGMIDYIHKLSNCWDSICNECLLSYSLLYKAEAYFVLYDLRRAEFWAHQAIPIAQTMEQHDIVINSYYLLIKINMCAGVHDKALDYLNSCRQYVKNTKASNFATLAEIVGATLDMLLDNDKDIALWIKNNDLSRQDKVPLWNAYYVFMCAMYAYYQGDEIKTLSLLSQMDKHYSQQGFWTLKISSLTVKCIIYYQLNDPVMAVHKFNKLYQMTYPYNIIGPIVEFGTPLIPVIKIAERNPDYSYDKEWLDKLKIALNEYTHNQLRMRKEYSKSTGSQKYDTRLSKRELQVLQLLSQGRSREEIAAAMGISINGVKKHLSSIYKKLGANNRAEAIYIASQSSLI